MSEPKISRMETKPSFFLDLQRRTRRRHGQGCGQKRAYMAAMESSLDDELCDDGMRVGGEAQVRGMKPALMFLFLATAALASGLLGFGFFL